MGAYTGLLLRASAAATRSIPNAVVYVSTDRLWNVPAAMGVGEVNILN